MTDNEIIKALKELLKELKGKKQLIVPEQGVKNLCYGLQNFLDLINRQKAEIKRLKSKVEPKGFKTADPMDFCGVLCDFAEGLIAKAKAEAYKEFAELLDAEIESSDKYIREYDDSEAQKAYNKGLRDALKVLKELVGEQPILNDVKCIDCEYLELELPYAVCSKAHKGIVQPNDSCGKGKLK